MIVGGGPAGLACANRVMQLLEDEPELTEKLGEIPVAVLEKGKVCGAHNLCGANVVPTALQELFPDEGPDDWPIYQEVSDDAVYLLTKKRALPLVPMPPNFRNHGNYTLSVSQPVALPAPSGRRRPAPTSSPRRSPTSCWSRTGSSRASAPATRAATARATSSATSSPAPT